MGRQSCVDHDSIVVRCDNRAVPQRSRQHRDHTHRLDDAHGRLLASGLCRCGSRRQSPAAHRGSTSDVGCRPGRLVAVARGRSQGSVSSGHTRGVRSRRDGSRCPGTLFRDRRVPCSTRLDRRQQVWTTVPTRRVAAHREHLAGGVHVDAI